MCMKSIERSWLSHTILTILLICITQYDAIVVAATKKSCPITTSTQRPINRALLIFLDDSESDDAQGEKKVGVVSHAFLSAFLQEAGPIVVSASLIVNVKEYQKPAEQNPQKLVDRFNTISKNLGGADAAALTEFKSIILAAISFNETTVQTWIIKRINSALYLLLPKKYVHDKNIPENALHEFISDDLITSVEQQLGLKVNHMPTVTDINEIKKPVPAPPFAEYFMQAMWDNTSKKSDIFVTNNEYRKYNNISVPLWSILIEGHGILGLSVIGLSLPQFKQFLTFLENKVRTKLLYYISCYGAGLQNKILYEDTERRIDTTYSFAIITQALTDAPIYGPFVVPSADKGQLKALSDTKHFDFLKKVTASDSINYHELAALITPDLKAFGISGLPQIKFPGLPWFSVIDDEKACSIGSILAKTRTAPLNIATFFGKKGKPAEPLGILLYTQDIPFELIVNTKTEMGKPPAIISMIPGNALHHIKRLSSQINSLGNLLFSFIRIKNLGSQKIFIIDEARGTNPGTDGLTVHDVVIKVTPRGSTIYWMEEDATLIKIMNEEIVKVSAEDEKEYAQLLSVCNPKKSATVTLDQITDLQEKIREISTEQMTNMQALSNVIGILDTMPNSVALRIPKIKGFSCPPENEYCWFEFLYQVAQYAAFDVHKLIWIYEVEVCSEEGNCQVILTNIIVDVTQEETKVLFTSNMQKMWSISNKTGVTELPEGAAYIAHYTTLFQYFKEHLRLPEQLSKEEVPTIQDLLTREAVVSLEKVQEKKQKDIKSRRNRNKSRARSRRHCND
jgi:hypothetical protein